MDEAQKKRELFVFSNVKTQIAWFKLSGYGGAAIDATKAVALLEESADAGDAEAMWMFGLCKEYGLGTERDMQLAESLYELSMSHGNDVGSFLFFQHSKGSRSMVIDCLLCLANHQALSQFSFGMWCITLQRYWKIERSDEDDFCCAMDRIDFDSKEKNNPFNVNPTGAWLGFVQFFLEWLKVFLSKSNE